MEEPLEDQFIREINQNIGIAHKVCNMYFSASEEGEDVLQEMMYQLWRSYPNFRQRSRFSTWMYRVCLNTALTYLRKNRKTNKESLTQQHHLIPDGENHQDENTAKLYQAIGRLSAVNKAIILLYLEDLTYEEIADITGLSKSNVSVRLVRVKKALESILNKPSNAIEDAKY